MTQEQRFKNFQSNIDFLNSQLEFATGQVRQNLLDMKKMVTKCFFADFKFHPKAAGPYTR